MGALFSTYRRFAQCSLKRPQVQPTAQPTRSDDERALKARKFRCVYSFKCKIAEVRATTLFCRTLLSGSRPFAQVCLLHALAAVTWTQDLPKPR